MRFIVLTILVLILSISTMLVFYSLTGSAQTNQPISVSILPPICQDHGGVNCKVINPDALVVCNDGTTDTSSFIYGVPECHNILEGLADQESDFMAKTGCYPPSELGCFNEQSYQNLYKILSDSGLSTSKLGKDELAQCRQQIDEYKIRDQDYHQCLIENGQPKFNLSGKIGLPILKSVFCPIFYGSNASYNIDADLCVCNKGYFMAGGTCTEAIQICRSIYGQGYYSKNGNCYPNINKPIVTPTLTPIITTSPKIILSPSNKITPTLSPIPLPYSSGQPIIAPSIQKENNINFVARIFTTIASSFKNILKLF